MTPDRASLFRSLWADESLLLPEVADRFGVRNSTYISALAASMGLPKRRTGPKPQPPTNREWAAKNERLSLVRCEARLAEERQRERLPDLVRCPTCDGRMDPLQPHEHTG